MSYPSGFQQSKVVLSGDQVALQIPLQIETSFRDVEVKVTRKGIGLGQVLDKVGKFKETVDDN